MEDLHERERQNWESDRQILEASIAVLEKSRLQGGGISILGEEREILHIGLSEESGVEPSVIEQEMTQKKAEGNLTRTIHIARAANTKGQAELNDESACNSGKTGEAQRELDLGLSRMQGANGSCGGECVGITGSTGTADLMWQAVTELVWYHTEAMG